MATLLTAVSAHAQEPATNETADAVTPPTQILELDTTSVTGNRELPKVLVIVPWKNPELEELSGRPLASLVEEVLSPIDPDVFRRQVNYYNDLNEAAAGSGDVDAGDTEADNATQSKDR
jgi:hypothetical protein